MSLLFQNEIVHKATINQNVLNQSPLIDSKSLDSHLYRLRKKLFIVDSTKKILLTENQVVKII
jgi:DNA-binding response OmpR family regulator